MESDWSSSFFTGDEDFVQSYRDYNSYPEEEGGGESQGLGDRDECYGNQGIENWLQELDEKEADKEKRKRNEDKKIVTFGSKPSKMRRKKSHQQKLLSPLERFYEIILSWRVNDLLSNQRKALKLPELLPQPRYFPSLQDYCVLQQQLPIEECRVSLIQGNKSPESGSFPGSFQGEDGDINQKKEGLQVINFEIRNSFELIKPGWIYYAFPDSDKNTITLPTHPPSKCSRFSSNHSSQDYQGTQKKKSKRLSVASQLANDISAVTGNCLIFTLATGKYGFSSLSSSSSSSTPFWVHSNSLKPFIQQWMLSIHRHILPLHWRIYPIQNIITYQRMFVACQDVPSLPLMKPFLGQRQPTHVTFDDTSEDEDKEDEEESPRGNETERKQKTKSHSNVHEDSKTNKKKNSNQKISQLFISKYSTVLDSSQLSSLSKIYESIQKSKSHSHRTQFSTLTTTAAATAAADCLHLIQGPPGLPFSSLFLFPHLCFVFFFVFSSFDDYRMWENSFLSSSLRFSLQSFR
jgi:hypothetical protein